MRVATCKAARPAADADDELGVPVCRGAVDRLSTVPNEPTLAERFSDDPDALDECYRTMGPMVLAFIRRLVGPTDAQDVLQQVFLDVWRSRERFDADAASRTMAVQHRPEPLDRPPSTPDTAP